MKGAGYAELHCLSNFSIQRGASSAGELFERAKQQSGSSRKDARDQLLQQAAQQFERTLRIDSENVSAHYNLHLIYALLGDTAKAGEPFIRQVLIGRNPALADDQALERKLFVILRRSNDQVSAAGASIEARRIRATKTLALGSCKLG